MKLQPERGTAVFSFLVVEGKGVNWLALAERPSRGLGACVMPLHAGMR